MMTPYRCRWLCSREHNSLLRCLACKAGSADSTPGSFCLQHLSSMQAYLRLGEAQVQVQHCSSAGASPSGEPCMHYWLGLDAVTSHGFLVGQFQSYFSIQNFNKPCCLMPVHRSDPPICQEFDCTYPTLSLYDCGLGQLPALDTGLDIVSAPGPSDFEAAHQLISHLKATGMDLDAHLDPSQQALCLAFSALIELRLRPATLYATWCEKESYSHYTRVGNQTQPSLQPVSNMNFCWGRAAI